MRTYCMYVHVRRNPRAVYDKIGFTSSILFVEDVDTNLWLLPNPLPLPSSFFISLHLPSSPFLSLPLPALSLFLIYALSLIHITYIPSSNQTNPASYLIMLFMCCLF